MTRRVTERPSFSKPFGEMPDEEGTAYNPGAEYAGILGKEEVETPEEEAIWSICADLQASAQDATIAVYKITNQNDKRGGEFLFREGPMQFNQTGFERIRDEYGGGMYRVHVKNPEGRLIANQIITIAQPLKKLEPDKSNVDMLAMIDKLMEKQTQNMLTILSPILHRMQAPVDSEEKILQRMMLYKELFVGNGQRQNGFDGMAALELIKQGMELAQNATGEAKESTLLDLVKEFGPKLLDTVKAASEVGKATASNFQTNEVGQIPAQIPTQKQIEINVLLNMLLPAAMKGSDTELYAEIVIDQIGVEKASALNASDFVSFDPAKLAPFTPWFNQLCNTIKEFIAEENNQIQGGEEMPFIDTTKMFVAQLVAAAKQNHDLDVVADAVIVSAGEKAKDLALNPAIIDEMAAINPAVKNYAKYFEDLRNVMKKKLDIS